MTELIRIKSEDTEMELGRDDATDIVWWADDPINTPIPSAIEFLYTDDSEDDEEYPHIVSLGKSVLLTGEVVNQLRQGLGLWPNNLQATPVRYEVTFLDPIGNEGWAQFDSNELERALDWANGLDHGAVWELVPARVYVDGLGFVTPAEALKNTESGPEELESASSDDSQGT